MRQAKRTRKPATVPKARATPLEARLERVLRVHDPIDSTDVCVSLTRYDWAPKDPLYVEISGVQIVGSLTGGGKGIALSLHDPATLRELARQLNMLSIGAALAGMFEGVEAPA
jgi:hypothetical protein